MNTPVENFELDLDPMIRRQQREDVMPASRAAHTQTPPRQKLDWAGIGIRLVISTFFVLLVVGCVLGYAASVSSEQNKTDINRLRIQVIKMSYHMNITIGEF